MQIKMTLRSHLTHIAIGKIKNKTKQTKQDKTRQNKTVQKKTLKWQHMLERCEKGEVASIAHGSET